MRAPERVITDFQPAPAGLSQYHAVQIPDADPSGPPKLPGTVLRPKDHGKTKFPGVLLLHGRGGNQCALWWTARLLAARKFETLVLTYPSIGNGSDPSAALVGDTMSIKGAMSWLRSASNPFVRNLDKAHLAIVGHSMGAILAADVQQDPSIGYLKTIVAYDNLRAYLLDDVSSGVACDKTMLTQLRAGAAISVVTPANMPVSTYGSSRRQVAICDLFRRSCGMRGLHPTKPDR